MLDLKKVAKIVEEHINDEQSRHDYRYFEISFEYDERNDGTVMAIMTGYFMQKEESDGENFGGVGPVELDGEERYLVDAIWSGKGEYLVERANDKGNDVELQILSQGFDIDSDLAFDDPLMSDQLLTDVLDYCGIHKELDSQEKEMVLGTYRKNGHAKIAQRIEKVIFR